MNQPTAFGRKLPRNDWEGDDFTPGADGAFVTCVDTAVGRMVAWATNGRIDKDGVVFRRAVVPADPNGITLRQAVKAVSIVARTTLHLPTSWDWAKVTNHLTFGGGLIIVGRYDVLPRAYRYQESANFLHAMFVSHRSRSSGMRVWDPLNRDTTRWGRWMTATIIHEYLKSADYYVGYVPLQPLNV